MDAKEIMQASQLDILFDGRNKAYGAYALRKNYNRRIKAAMAGTGLMVLLFVGATRLPHKKAPDPVIMIDPIPVHLTKLSSRPLPPKAPPPAPRPAPRLEMQRLAVPRVVDDKLVPPDEKPPRQTDPIRVGPVTQHGRDIDGLLSVPPETKSVGGDGSGLPGGSGNQPDYQQVFKTVQIEARYPGGPAAWKKYLERNLRSQTPVDNGATNGIYTVVVSFLVAKDGTTSEVRIVSAPDPDYGTAQEAVRVIERSGKWQPAIQNGRAVIYREKQGITFQVNE